MAPMAPPPPPDPSRLRPEYLAEDQRGGYRAGMIVIITAAEIVTLLRFYSRGFLTRNVGLDDYLMGVTSLVALATLALCLLILDLGAGRHMTALKGPELAIIYKHVFSLEMVYHFGLWWLRISGLAFYARLYQKTDRFRIWMWVSFAFVTAVGIAQALIHLLQCIPITSLWNGKEGRCMTQFAVFVSTAGLTIACDTLILLIPVRIIWQLRMSRKQKLGLAFVLLVGVFAVGTSIFRIMSMVPAVTTGDPTWHFAPIMFWSCMEVGIGIMALSVPALKPIFSKIYKSASQAGSKGYSGFGASNSKQSSYVLQSFRSTKPTSSQPGAGARRNSVENISEENLCKEAVMDPTTIRKTVDVHVKESAQDHAYDRGAAAKKNESMYGPRH